MTQTTAPRPQVPPDEAFWQRYSPNHEFPVSTVTSIAVHVLAIVLLLVGAWLIARLGLTPDRGPLDIQPVIVEGGNGPAQPGGGREAPPLGEAVAEPERPRAEKAPAIPPLPEPGGNQAVPLSRPVGPDPNAERRLLDEVGRARGDLKGINDRALAKMLKGLDNDPPGGGPGPNQGPPGGGKGQMQQRMNRVLRWAMVFETRTGEDYARQLHALGAIVAYPDPNRPEEYLAIEDLRQRPAKGVKKDLTALNRIFWVDSTPESVRSLAAALQLPVPPHFVAFFPEEVEKELLQLELKYRNLPEEQIASTRFKLVPAGDRFKPVVTEQQVR